MMNSKKILVVDDDPAIRGLVAAILRRYRLEVDTAADGFEAIEKLMLDDYAVILLDLMMPRVDGLGVLGFLRQQDIDSLRSVILLTASDTTSVHSEPVWTIMTKPFDIEYLVQQVTRCLERDDWQMQLRAS